MCICGYCQNPSVFSPPQIHKCQEFQGPMAIKKVCNHELFKKLRRTAAAHVCLSTDGVAAARFPCYNDQ